MTTLASAQPDHWEPIKDLPDNWRELASAELAGLAAVWRERHEVLAGSDELKQFNERLAREWAIETGVIENLYTLDRGTTQLLIEHGINADLIRNGGSDKPAEYVAALVSDQQDALEGVFDFVKGNRELTTSYIKELHVAFTRHQPTVTGMDQFGNLVETTLLRGEWKQQPNNPSRPDGTLAHFYTPPVHTASEMERLVAMNAEIERMGVPPEVAAAWLHHRFTQIHPFQDGNGRVARAIASMVFIKAGMFPVVIRRKIRDRYISALEKADEEDLSPMVGLFTDQQKISMLSVLNVSQGVMNTESALDDILHAAANTLQSRSEAVPQRYLAVYALSEKLEDIAKKTFVNASQKVRTVVESVDQNFSALLRFSDNTERRLSGKVAERVSKEQGYVVDASTYDALVGMQILEKRESRLEIVFNSFGLPFTGALAVTSYFYQPRKAQEYKELATSPFTFTYKDDAAEVETRFKKWLDEVILFGLDEWRRQL